MADPQDVNVVGFLGETGIDAMGAKFREGWESKKQVDDAMRQFQTALKPILDDIKKTFDDIGEKLLQDIRSAVGSSGGGTTTSGGRSASGTKYAGGLSAVTKVEKTKIAGTEAATAQAEDIVSSGGGALKKLTGLLGGGGGGGLGGIGKFIKTPMAGVALGAINTGINAANARFDRGREGVLEADRMSVLYQQMTGLSQLGVSSQYRMPLTNYRLGAGGINAVMGLEAQTGIRGTQQASSIEAMRTLSGYSMSAGEVTGQIASLASAPTANRMFMMTGMGLIGPGGKQNTTMDVIKNLVNVAGLTSKEVVDSAMLPGSITRAKLTSMGVPPEMQTQVIQYAKSNLTYKEKGGKGMYDPSRKADRKRMGIEENFATQVEETQRLETKRDEQFYRRQVDNYAALERQTQTLTRAFGALEDKLSGILGFTASNRIATTLTQGIINPTGDPDRVTADVAEGKGMQANKDASTAVPTYGGNKSLNQVKNLSSFKKLHPKMQDRLLRMMRDNPAVGFGQGVRASTEQRQMFLSRYRKTDAPTDANGQKNIMWEGSYWEHVSGAAAAPPGRSMHEIGLAADLTGDLAWVVENAHKYGLRHFADVNGESWHVQPSELPGSRAQYEKSGAVWGHGPDGAAPFDKSSTFAEPSGGEHGGRGGRPDDGSTFGTSTDPSWEHVSGLVAIGSISRRVKEDISNITSKAPSGGSVGSGSNRARNRNTVAMPGSFGKGQLTGEQVAMLLYQVGFRGEDIAKGVAISKRESRWNSMAYNPNRKTGDNSYGLFQINMIEKYAEARRKWFGISTDDALFDPLTNAKAAKMMYDGKKSAKGNGWYDWGPYKKKPETYNTDMGEATRIVKSIGLGGDPPIGASSPSKSVNEVSSMSVVGGHTFNINPTINMGGNGSNQDLKRIAKDLAVMVRRELELELLRSS